LGADWREQWCFKGLSIGGEGLSGSSPGSSDWSETVCDDRTPASSDPPVYLPWPRIPVPEAGDQLQAQYARSDDIGVVLLSEPMDSTQSSCLPEPPPIACDLQFPPSSSGLGRCVGEIGHPPQPTYAQCALCSVIQQHANVPLRFVAYRQSRAGPSEAPGDFYQISPLLDAPWCDLEVNAFGSVTRLNDPWFSLVNVATGNEWPGYRLLFTDRFPFRDDRQLRYKFVLFDERGEIAGHRLSNWITPQ
ncbi:MAG: hypothetical protein KDK91_34095, partial [Gammaproteobacteria bacterium]|nr:hypothetical protein [Gammaproteobacteria bacterium]